MKRILVGIAAVAACVGVMAQGTINPNMLDPAVGVNWQVTDGGDPLAAGKVAIITTDGTTLAVNSIVAQGYVVGAPTVVVDGAAPGSTLEVKIAAWNFDAADYAAAKAGVSADNKLGESPVLALTLGGDKGDGTPPLLPASLAGQGTIAIAGSSWVPSPTIPEPTSLALGLFGAGLLLLRRRR